MKKYLGLLAVLIMALGLALNVSAAETKESGELNLSVNTPVDVTVKGEYNTQLTFTPSKTQKYIFIVTGREYTYADSLKGDGEYLQWENNWYNNKKHIMISPELQANTQYSIELHKGNSAAESDNYKVAIYDELNKGVDSLTIGKDYSGTINSAQYEATFYKLDINDDNKEVQFELGADKVKDLSLELYDQEFNQIAINRNRPYQSGMLYAGAVLENGTYYLKVYNQYQTDNNINYTLKMNPLKKRTTVEVSIPPFLQVGEKQSLWYYDSSSTEGYYADKVSFTTEDRDIISITEGDFQGKKPGTAKIIAKNLAGEEIAQKEVTIYKDSITEEDALQTIETNETGETIVAFTPAKSQKYLFKIDATDAKLSLTRVEYDTYITSPTMISYVDAGEGRVFTQTSLTAGGTYYLKIANVKGKKIQLGAYTNLASDWSKAAKLPFSEKQSINNIESNYQFIKKITVNEAGNYTFKLASEDYTTARNAVFILMDENYTMKMGTQKFPTEEDSAPYIRTMSYNGLAAGNYYVFAICTNNLKGQDISYRASAFRIAENPITLINIAAIPNLTAGQTMKISYEITPAATETDDTVLFESSDESVATITKDGEITAVGAGKATITVMNASGDVVKTSEVTVEKAKESEQPTTPSTPQNPTTGTKPATNKTETKVKTLKIVAKSHVLAVGKRRQLKVQVAPETAKTSVIWKSSNKKYATVNKNGKVLAKRAGRGKKVVITAIAKDGSGVKAIYKIRIAKGVVKKIKITGNKNLKAGKTVKLRAKVTGTKGCYKKVTWISSNPEIATVTSSGKVKAAKNAKNKKVKITARVFDGAGKIAVIYYLIH